MQALEWVGLADKASKKPNKLSGGESQRVAIARSLAKRPKMILGDELTGNLDTKTSKQVMESLVAEDYKCNPNQFKIGIILVNSTLKSIN